MRVERGKMHQGAETTGLSTVEAMMLDLFFFLYLFTSTFSSPTEDRDYSRRRRRRRRSLHSRPAKAQSLNEKQLGSHVLRSRGELTACLVLVASGKIERIRAKLTG